MDIPLTDAEWRAFQDIPDQGYSHRAWVDHKIQERVEALVAENAKLQHWWSDDHTKGAAFHARAIVAERERDAAQHIIETHTCGENVELAYRRTIEAQDERDALRSQLAEAEAVRLRLLERLSHLALSEVAEAAPGYLDPRGLHPVLADRDARARKEALREAAEKAVDDLGDLDRYAEPDMHVSKWLRALAEGDN